MLFLYLHDILINISRVPFKLEHLNQCTKLAAYITNSRTSQGHCNNVGQLIIEIDKACDHVA